MAMYERRGSMEAFDRQWHRTLSPTGSERRKLSFNPVAEWTPPTAEEPLVGAFEVSKTKRVLQVAVAVVYCLLAAGVVFGYAAIKPVLIHEGVYKYLCTQQELDDGVWVCYKQELSLNLMFTVAAVSTNVSALPGGTILDRCGPRVASIIGVVFLSLGALTLAFASDLPFDAYIPGYLFLALGGPFVFIPSFHLSNTFPAHSGLILALLTGAFDTSSAVFLVYRLMYQATEGTITLKKFFLAYLIVPALILVAQVFIMPHSSYKTVGELVKDVEISDAVHVNGDDDALARQNRRVSEVEALLGSKKGDKQARQEEKKAKKSGVWGALHGQTAIQQIRSPWFLFITLFTIVQMTRINYFMATVRTQYTELLHSHSKAVQINEFFDVALPLGGVVAIPIIGLVLDHTSTPFALGVLVTVATTIGIFGIVPETWAAYTNITLFVLYRPLYYTAVSDYSAKVFGFATFGKVYGLMICLAGLFNFSQTGLDTLTHKTFHDDPVPVNVFLLGVAFVVGLGLVGYVTRQSFVIRRDKMGDEVDGTREAVMPSTAL